MLAMDCDGWQAGNVAGNVRERSVSFWGERERYDTQVTYIDNY